LQHGNENNKKLKFETFVCSVGANLQTAIHVINFSVKFNQHKHNNPVSSEISALLFFVSYFASQIIGINLVINF